MAGENPFQAQVQPEKSQAPDSKTPVAEEAPKRPRAWQPFTPRGIAAFASASGSRLLLVQVVMALLSALAIVWFAWYGWIPEIKEAIRNLPAEGVIERQQLKLHVNAALPLADKRGLLGIGADPENTGGAPLRSDLKIQLRKDQYEICFLLGCRTAAYPKGELIQFNRLDLEPRWEAWEPFLLAGLGLGSGGFIFVSWLVLAALYFPFILLFGYLRKREVSLGGSWRLAAAALMPGAVLLSIGIVCYGLGIIDMVRLFTLAILHLIIGWVYLGMAAATLPGKSPPQSPLNPFSPAEPDSAAAKGPPTAPPPATPHPEERPGSQLDNPS